MPSISYLYAPDQFPMIAIADGGSTKTDWLFAEAAGPAHQLQTKGFNPYYLSRPEMDTRLREGLRSHLNWHRVSEVHFYGAGCSDQARNHHLRQALQDHFPSARIEVSDDLLGAARATCQISEGIVGILGTGSNSAYYDGAAIKKTVTNLGFYLGDEGSGSHLGKLLIQAYFYEEMPEELAADFARQYALSREGVLNNIYGNSPNVYLASFSKFAGQHQTHQFIVGLVQKAFAEFIDRHIRKYQHHQQLPIHFVGSIAHYFRDILLETLAKRELRAGLIVSNPISLLLKYHLSQKQ